MSFLCLLSDPSQQALTASFPPLQNSYQKKFCNDLPLEKLLPKKAILCFPQDYFPNYYRNEHLFLLSAEAKKLYLPLLNKLKVYANNRGLKLIFRAKKSKGAFCIEALRPSRVVADLKISLLDIQCFKHWDLGGRTGALFQKVLSPFFLKQLAQRCVPHPTGIPVPCVEDDLWLRMLQTWHKPFSDTYKSTRAKVQKKASPAFKAFLYKKAPFPKKQISHYLQPDAKTKKALGYLLIWPSAIHRLALIQKSLQNYGGFRLRAMTYYTFKNLQKLLMGVYQKENSPWIVQKKMRYLKKMPAFCLLATLEHPFLSEEAMQKKLKELKEYLRQAFNPLDKNGEISSKHILHSLDSKKELKNILPHLIKAKLPF